MLKMLLVAWREFKHTALTRAFIIGAVLTPVAIAAVMFLMPRLLKTTIPPVRGPLILVADGSLVPAVEFHLQPDQVQSHAPGFIDLENVHPGTPEAAKLADVRRQVSQWDVNVEVADPGADVDALKNQVRKGDAVALVIVPPTTLQFGVPTATNTFELYIQGGAAPNNTETLQNVIEAAIVRERVRLAGMNEDTARALVRRPDSDTKRLTVGGGEGSESTEFRMFIPMGFMMLLWIATFTSGNYLLTSTIEEKSNKVMEVLLSAVSPFQLMGGKILGQAGVSFLMLAMYGGLGIAAMMAAAKFDLIPWIHLVYLMLYFIMAYFMIASIMAGVGSAVSEVREAQSLITPAMLLLMIPLLLWFPIINDPNGLLATITSFIPPLIPFVMILRVTAATEPVPIWQIIATIVAGYCWMLVMIWMCAKIFRVGVLMTGKPPTPIELLRWVRYR